MPAGDHAPPSVLVRDCRFVRTWLGIVLIGINVNGEKYGNPAPVHAIAVRDNLFLDCISGVEMKGSLRKVQVVGNRFHACSRCAWQIEQLLEQSGDILVANNTALECGPFLRVWDEKVRSRGVRICNNLSLGAAYPDAVVWNSGGNPLKSVRHGDGTTYSTQWLFSHNWREVEAAGKPKADKSDGRSPPGTLDIHKDKIEGVNRAPRTADFLRPDKDSPLATKGAGQDDPTLPSYVGAVPPTGVAPWDWDRTWRARR